MTRWMIPATLALLAALAPTALAQDEKPVTNESDAENPAWVEDCPPDMMCAYGGESREEENATYSGDCGAEVCAYDSPQELGPEGCIDCTTAPPRDGDAGTCMDGEQENESCDEDVYYMDGPSRGPSDGSCENCRGDDGLEADPVNSHAPAEGADAPSTSADDAQKTVPGAGLTLGLLAVAGVAILVASRRAD